MTTGRMGNRAGTSAVLGILCIAVFFMTLLAPGAGTALAARDRLVLELHDRLVRSHRGQWETLHLKRILREQYPWVKVDDLDLRRVVLIAKSRHGRGDALLRVGHRVMESHSVYGRSGRFRDDRRHFDQVDFGNLSFGSGGPWQIDLRGDFIVRKVVLEVDDRPHRHRPAPRPYRFDDKLPAIW